jgi:hypothetical protein
VTQSLSAATRGQRPRVAFVTCAHLPDLDADDRLAAQALAERGVAVQPAVWDDPAVDWSGYDLGVIRSTWDYPPRRGEFLAWARRVPRLANPARVLDWNTDKRYLATLAAAGVSVVPTRWLAPSGAQCRTPADVAERSPRSSVRNQEVRWPPARGEYVVKPAVGAGSVDTGRYDLADAEHRTLAAAHVSRLLADRRTVMIQPYLPAVDRDGETALMFIGGRYSHAVRKGALLDGPYLGLDGLYKVEDIAPREATAAQLAVAQQALRAVPGVRPEDLLYARVDLIPGPDGEPLLVELELTEPSLFVGYAPGAAARFAGAVVTHLDVAGLGSGA